MRPSPAGYINSPYDIPTRTVASIVTILGILYFSIVLGLVVEAVQAKMNALREGRSLVVEKEHTVMLGWTEKSLLFIKEIINANESEGGGVVAVGERGVSTVPQFTPVTRNSFTQHSQPLKATPDLER